MSFGMACGPLNPVVLLVGEQQEHITVARREDDDLMIYIHSLANLGCYN